MYRKMFFLLTKIINFIKFIVKNKIFFFVGKSYIKLWKYITHKLPVAQSAWELKLQGEESPTVYVAITISNHLKNDMK